MSKKIVYSTDITETDNTSNVGEAVTGIAAEASGNAFMAGYTSACSFPTTAGGFQPRTSSPHTLTNPTAGTTTQPLWAQSSAALS